MSSLITEYKRAPFQVEDLRKLRKLEHSANWSEMSCFKTTTAQFLQEDLSTEKILVVTTKSGKTPWFRTAPYILGKKLDMFNIDARGWHYLDEAGDQWKMDPDVLGVGAKRGWKLPPGLHMAHFDLFQTRSVREGIGKLLLMREWDSVIIDEAHRIKNYRGPGSKQGAQWSRNLHRLKRHLTHIMTGSPFVNSPDELWSLLRFLDKKAFPAYWLFRDTYTKQVTDFNTGRKFVIGVDNKRDLQRLLLKYGVRRTRREVLKDLPVRLPDAKRYVELTREQRRMYTELKKELKTLVEAGEEMRSPSVLSVLQRLRMITDATPYVTDDYYDPEVQRRIQKIELREPSPKLDELMSDVEQLADTSAAAVFSYFNGTLDLLEKRLRKAGIKYTRMRQVHTDIERSRLLESFQSGRGGKLFLSTIKLGGESIDLFYANTVMRIDRDWTHTINEQVVARVERNGQTQPVQVIDYEARGTTDQVVEQKVALKKKWFQVVEELSHGR